MAQHNTTTTDVFPKIWAGAIAAFTFVLYFGSLSNGFTNWDDPSYVLENPMMKEGIGSVFSKTILGNYHPLTMLTLWLNYQMSGLNAKGFHLFNLLLHVANTYLVFRFIWLISDKKKIVAALVALFFAIHPMHVESVAWIAERKDVLYSFFLLLGLNSYLKYLQENDYKALIITFLYFVLSLLSKPSAVVFPALLLLLDYYKERPWEAKIWKEKVAFFAIAIAFAVLTYSIQIKDEAVRSLAEYSIFDRVLFACYDLMMYIVESIVPFQLSPVHPFPNQPFPTVFYVAPLFVFCLLGLIYLLRKQKVVLFGMGFFLVNLVLVLQIVTIGQAVMSERYTYLSYIGLFFVFAYFIDNQLLAQKNKQLIYGLVAAFSLAFSWLTLRQIDVWKDTVSMWTAVLDVYPDSEAGLYNRGTFYSGTAGKEALALADLEKLIIVKPTHVEGITKRGRLLMSKYKQYDKAFADFDRAQSLTNDPVKLAVIIANRSYCYFYSGDKVKALSEAKEAMKYGAQIDPKYWAAINSNDAQTQQQSNSK
jgi:protein O-mannosyl-transferase